MRDLLNEFVTNPKIAVTVGASTTATGAAGWLNWIPMDDITKLATLCGAVLSLVLIVTHIHRAVMEHRRQSLEIEIARVKEQERRERVVERLRRGEPVRRSEDR